MTKVTINENTKKEAIEKMLGGTIFTYNNNYYMYINSDTIVKLSDFTVWDFSDFPEGEYVTCNAEIIIRR